MPDHPITHRLRQGLLALAALATLVTPLELIFIEHYSEPLMLIPLVLTGLSLLAIIAIVLWPNPQVFKLFRVVMLLLILGSAVGVFFHLRGNTEVVQEVDSELQGLSRLWAIITGGAPALAPGLLAQVGLLGLLYTYKHPKLQNT
jgi:predicted RND superfamily exporter protein